MIKFGIRNNLIYPIIFSLLYGLSRIITIILSETFIKYRAKFLLGLLKFIFEFIIGILFMCIFSNNSKSNKNTKEKGIKLIQNNNELERPDSYLKIFFLILFAALFEFTSTYARRYVLKSFDHRESRLMHLRLRSLEIVSSSLLSYYFLKIKIYRHQFYTLIIISISLIIALTLEFIYIENKSHIKHVFEGLIVLLSSTLTTSSRDIIEKYLFDIDHIDVFKLTFCEGLINTLISIPFYCFKIIRTEIYELFQKNIRKIFCIIIYLLLYGIICGFKSIYRRNTLIQYSPMTRALAESLWDPFFIIYKDFIIKNPYKKMHSILALILSFIMVFCSCVYNELIVLYCFGMEYETYIEVNRRSIISKIEEDITDISISKSKSITYDEEKQKEEENNLFD